MYTELAKEAVVVLGPVHMEWATSLRWDVSQLSFI